MFASFVCGVRGFAQGSTTPYQKELTAIHARFNQLETERTDYRSATRALDNQRDAERQRLMGQLHLLDPYWTYEQQLEADIDALATGLPTTDADREKVLDAYKQTLARLAGLSTAATQKEAETEVATLRVDLATKLVRAGH